METARVSLAYKYPVRLDERAIREIDAAVKRFALLSVTSFVRGQGIPLVQDTSTDEIKSLVESAKEIDIYDKRRINEQIYSVVTIGYELTLGDKSVVATNDVSDVFRGTNDGRDFLEQIVLSNKTYGAGRISVTMKITKYGMEPVTVDVRDSLPAARQVRDDIEHHLDSSRPPWWRIRNLAAIAGIGAVFMVGLNAYNLYSGIKLASEPNPSGQIILLIYLLLILVFLLAGIMPWVIRGWDWLFPMAEFAWARGQARSEMRAKVRKFLFWGFPITMVGAALVSLALEKLLA